MTNEMKLLMAMCDAMGFEVEGIADCQHHVFRYELTKKPVENDIYSRDDVTPTEIMERERDLQRKSNLILSLRAERSCQAIGFAEYHKAMKDLGL